MYICPSTLQLACVQKTHMTESTNMLMFVLTIIYTPVPGSRMGKIGMTHAGVGSEQRTGMGWSQNGTFC